VSAFLAAVLDNPTRWRLILTVPDSAPRDYRDSLRTARSSILAQSEALANAGIALDPRLDGLDSSLLGHTMLRSPRCSVGWRSTTQRATPVRGSSRTPRR
jgi:hypothetical protein